MNLPSLFLREVINQSMKFTEDQNLTQRALAMASSTTLIVFCLVSMYFFLAIDPKRLVFRHQLIAFLISFDLLKAVILLIFPSRVLTHASAYNDEKFCQVVGFFTVTAIQGADLAILSFAIHTFLLIFRPDLTVKLPNSDRVEGGLYMYRYYVYGLSFLIPLVMASLPYVSLGYSSFVCWCYLPQKPVWYRLVLSWVPRFCIVITILTVYGLIYYYVLREFRTLGGVFTTMHKLKQKAGLHPSVLNQKPTFFSSLGYFIELIKDSILPKLVLPDDDKLSPHSTNTSSMDPISRPGSPPRASVPARPLDAEMIMADPDIQQANLENFRKRQKTIQRQMKSIFVYPFAYIFVWLGPFILQCTQFNYEWHHHPIFWLNCVGAFMQPFNGTVDSLVFLYREQPWKYTIMKNFEKEHSGKLDHYVMRSYSNGDLSSLDTNARLTKNSLVASMHVDVDQYPRWRRIASRLRLPLMHLPTEENIAKFQNSYINSRIEEQRESGVTDMNEMGDYNVLQGTHDFSNLLSGNFAEGDFRLTFDNYSLNFSLGRRPSAVSSHSATRARGERRGSVATVSNKSNKSRRMSIMDPHIPIPEDAHYVPGSAPVGNKASVSNKRSSTQKSQRSSNAEDTELDFLEFLRKGPVP